MENYRNWFPGVHSIKSVNTLPHGIEGKAYEEMISLPQGLVSLVIDVKRSKYNERFYTEGDLSPLFPSMLMEFEEISLSLTRFWLRYYSRNTELSPDSEMIKETRDNLSSRILIAAGNLQNMFGSALS